MTGRAILVTGASRGIGTAIAQAFAAAGDRVAVHYRAERAAAESALASLDGQGHVVVQADLADPQAVRRMVDEAAQRLGGLDVLVNNAGILTFAPIADMPLADFRRVLEVNAVGCWLGMKAVIGPMTKAGGGSIVNVSSIEGFTGAAGLSAYSASKFAIRGMTKAAAQELGQFGIRVNSVHPGGVLTRMVLDQAETGRDGERFLGSLPLGRFADPLEISRLVAYLASDESSYSTGSEFVADGGVLSGPGY